MIHREGSPILIQLKKYYFLCLLVFIIDLTTKETYFVMNDSYFQNLYILFFINFFSLI